jgi:hypothetical protein
MERNGVESFVPKEYCDLYTEKASPAVNSEVTQLRTTEYDHLEEKAEMRKNSEYLLVVRTFKVIPIGLH